MSFARDSLLVALIGLWHLNGGDSRVITFTRPVNLPPVVFIPGDGGSQVEAKINIEDDQPGYDSSCPKKRDWFREWLNLGEILDLKCQVQVLRNFFDGKTNTSYSPPGVETRIPGFGTAHYVEYIDDSWEAYILGDIGAYAHALVEELVSVGLTRDVSVLGAPYDFRLSMASQNSYFKRLRDLIEKTYRINNARVALITHSMGGLYTAWFLKQQTQEWKDKYIKCFISLSTPWGGSTESLQAVVSGYTFHHSSIIDPLIARQEQRTWESNFLLFPSPNLFSNDDVFILTDQQNYTISRSDVLKLLDRIGVPTDIYEYVADANKATTPSRVLLPHPGVDTYCVYGTEIDTNHVMDYRGKTFPDESPAMVKTAGDGTAVYESLSACKLWNLGSRAIEIPQATHNGVLTEKPGIEVVLNILQGHN